MSITINVGVSKKIGLPDYGSAGSHCQIEVQAENHVLDDPQQFLHRVRDAFESARLAVDEELSHHRTNNGTGHSHSHQGTEQRQEYRTNNSNSDNSYSGNYANGNRSNGNQSNGNRYVASPKQLDFIWQLAKGVKMDKRKLEKYCDHRFGKGCAQLSTKEASELINELKDAKNGGKELGA